MRKELTIDEPIQRKGVPLAAKEAIFTNASLEYRRFRGQGHFPARRIEKGSAMIEMQMENERVEQRRLQQFGEDWIHAIAEGELDRLELFCSPKVNSRVLTPGQFVNLNSAADLVAKYKDWFAELTDFQVEASRVVPIGKRLGISYRFLLRDDEDWFRIEQQLFCTLKDGRVQQLHLLCSGFQRVGTDGQAAPAVGPQAGDQDPVRHGLLEFYGDGSVEGCP